jgi:GNAT superfamily N-acetyltransferase
MFATAELSRTTDSMATVSQEILIAHAVGTKCINTVVTDDSMGLPPEFDPSSERYRDPKLPGWDSSNLPPSKFGHQEAEQTLGLHSLGVLPEYQGKGYGKIMLRAYIERMRAAGIAKRIAIIAHDHLVGFYKGFGFADIGESEVRLGGGGWRNMVGDFKTIPG